MLRSQEAGPQPLVAASSYEPPEPRGPGGSSLVAGARFGPDSDNVAVVTARWLYAGVKQETREMVRAGLAA